MRRVGTQPLRRLFLLMAGPEVTSSHRNTPATGDGEFFAGLRTVAIDGTQMAIADTEANRRYFPKPAAGPNGPAGYPTIRLVTLVTCGTRHLLDAVFGSDTRSEKSYAAELTDPDRAAETSTAMGAGMLVLADRNFATRTLMRRVTATGAQFLMRIKHGAHGLKLPVDQTLPDGSYLPRVTCPDTGTGMVIRVIDASVTTTTAATSESSDYRLVTSLTDPAVADAEALVSLYHRRWAMETSYREAEQQDPTY